MSYTPTTTFVAGNVLQASQLAGNDDALRKYLHDGIVAGDMRSSPAWVETRHVQPPLYRPYTNTQHGTTGSAGGLHYRPGERYTMASSTFTRRARGEENPTWSPLPGTAMSFDIRGDTTGVFHFHFSAYVGPDTTTVGPAGVDRRVHIAPYVYLEREGFSNSRVYEFAVQEVGTNRGTPNSQTVGGLFNTSAAPAPSGPFCSYHVTGYGQRTGHMLFNKTAASTRDNVVHVGLAHWSLVQRSIVVGWTVSLETFY
jgi:hypothetical protein